MQPSHPIHAPRDSCIGEWFHQVIRRCEVECLNRVAGISGDENEYRKLVQRRFFLQGTDDVDSVDVRHLDIQKNDVRPVGADHLDRFSAVSRAREDFDPVQCGQNVAEPITRDGFIIRYESGKCNRWRRDRIRLVGHHAMENTIRRRKGRTRTPNGRWRALNGLRRRFS